MTCRATWWAQATGGVTYARCDLPARYLPGKVLQLGFGDLVPDENGDPCCPRQEGAAVWSFPGNATRGTIMAGMQEWGVPVFVEVDDLYFLHPPRLPGQKMPWRQTLDRRATDEHSYAAHRKITGFADGVICSTPQLAREYRVLNQNVHVCPNTVDPPDWEGFTKPVDGVFRVGFAGSQSHWVDAPLIYPALEWASRQPGVEVVWIGQMPRNLGPQVETLKDRLNESPPNIGFPVRNIPWTDTLESFRANLFWLDVGLCPLRPSKWANCKSDIKALEYAMAGALPVVSEVEAYRYWLRDDVPGLTAAGPYEFKEHVMWAVRNQEEARAMAATCKQHVLDERTTERNVWLWEEALSLVPA